MMSDVVLVTGSSSGIGRAMCLALHRRGYRVVATARRLESLHELTDLGIKTLPLDVNQPEQVEQTIAAVLDSEKRLDILINNAGYGQFGPLIELPLEQLQAQFQTNTFAPLRLIQQVAPVMRSQGKGMIVNISSISGVVPTPFAGPYCASKAALRAYSEVLRMELAPFGIAVVTVEPGAIQSNFGTAAAQRLIPLDSDSWYADIAEQVQTRAQLSQADATPADEFAERLVTMITTPRPPAVVRLGKKSRLLPFLKRWLPQRILDWILARRFGLQHLQATPPSQRR
jgi:NAD(P)-dependent dehydrogenase (short-subunit alcohol dehydrogenase family)